MRQGTLFGPPWLVDPQTDIERKFADFHAKNPHILAELERRAIRLLQVGARRIGVKAIWESLRYDALIRTDTREWKLNNSYTASYARLLIDRNPQLADVIETRRRHESAA